MSSNIICDVFKLICQKQKQLVTVQMERKMTFCLDNLKTN